jgi:hypothetical protein
MDVRQIILPSRYICTMFVTNGLRLVVFSSGTIFLHGIPISFATFWDFLPVFTLVTGQCVVNSCSTVYDIIYDKLGLAVEIRYDASEMWFYWHFARQN